MSRKNKLIEKKEGLNKLVDMRSFGFHKESINDIIYNIQIGLMSNPIFESNVDTPSEITLPYFSFIPISLGGFKKNITFTFGGSAYPFSNIKERTKTCKSIRKILLDRGNKYAYFETVRCQKDPLLELHPYPLLTTIKYPQYIYDTFDKNRESDLNEQNAQYFTINSKNLYNLYEKGIIKSINFNKTIIDLYLKKKSKKYVECRNFIISRMEDSCNIDETPSLYDIPKAKSLLYDKQPEEESDRRSGKTGNGVEEKHPNYKDLGVVAQAIVEILATVKKIKHNKLNEKLETNYPDLDVEYIQSLSQAFRDEAKLFYKDEIGHDGGYWYLKRPDIYAKE